jgi:glycosyltransferase involved in cell wall biosynthesis
MIRLAVIVPDRGDRPELFNNCKWMIESQTLQPIRVTYVDFPPTDEKCDITKRYRKGYDVLRGQNYDLIAFMENDDYYSPDYLEVMVREWEKAGRPDLFGTNRSIYYHIVERRYVTLYHSERAPMFNTFIRPDLNFIWPQDFDPYTDVWLWMTSSLQNKDFIKSKSLWEPNQMISMGIKHGVGLTGGEYHKTKMHRYNQEDPHMSFFRSVLHPDSFEFYSAYAESLKAK